MFYGTVGRKGKAQKGLDLLVIRSKANDKLGNARPCHNCLDMMRSVGISKVYYSTDNGIICERVKDMISIQTSSVTKYIEQKYYNAPTNDKDYFERLLVKRIPNRIKIKNFNYFLKHNFNNVLPNYTYTRKVKNGIMYVSFLNDCGNIVSKTTVF